MGCEQRCLRTARPRCASLLGFFVQANVCLPAPPGRVAPWLILGASETKALRHPERFGLRSRGGCGCACGRSDAMSRFTVAARLEKHESGTYVRLLNAEDAIGSGRA